MKIGETEKEMKARAQAFMTGLNNGTIVSVRAGLPEAPVSDGNVYTITAAD